MKTLQNVCGVLLLAMWLMVAARAAEMPVDKENSLEVKAHNVERIVEIKLSINLDCDISKIIEKYGPLAPSNKKGMEKLRELVRDRLQETGKELLDKYAPILPTVEPKPAAPIAPKAKPVV